MQKGHLFSRSGAWYVRYYEKSGREVIRRAKHLGYLKHYPTKESIQPVLDAFMGSVNVITLDEFIEFRYLPYTKELRPSTHQGYVKLWKARIKGLPEAKLPVKDYHPVDVQALLNAIAARKLFARSTLSHIKGFLSGCFRYAVFSGVRDTNPVRECKIPRGGKPPRKTYAYTMAEIQKILLVLDSGLKTAVATAAFAGLRLAELQGLQWKITTAKT